MGVVRLLFSLIIFPLPSTEMGIFISDGFDNNSGKSLPTSSFEGSKKCIVLGYESYRGKNLFLIMPLLHHKLHWFSVEKWNIMLAKFLSNTCFVHFFRISIYIFKRLHSNLYGKGAHTASHDVVSRHRDDVGTMSCATWAEIVSWIGP